MSRGTTYFSRLMDIGATLLLALPLAVPIAVAVVVAKLWMSNDLIILVCAMGGLTDACIQLWKGLRGRRIDGSTKQPEGDRWRNACRNVFYKLAEAVGMMVGLLVARNWLNYFWIAVGSVVVGSLLVSHVLRKARGEENQPC